MEPLLAAMLAAGLASGVHCVGMCGGIVTAFDARRTIPIRPQSAWPNRFAFNAGRISSYAAAGAAAGALGSAAYAAGALPLQDILYVAANMLLVFIGLHLAGAGRLLSHLEALGGPLWRRLQPLAARLLPARTLPQAYCAGLVWGWLPCAMVYAALAAAAFAGSAQRGAAAMLAFGLGTLPFLLAAGWFAARLRAWRVCAGTLVAGFGVIGLAQAAGIADSVRRGILCL